MKNKWYIEKAVGNYFGTEDTFTWINQRRDKEYIFTVYKKSEETVVHAVELIEDEWKVKGFTMVVPHKMTEEDMSHFCKTKKFPMEGKQ